MKPQRNKPKRSLPSKPGTRTAQAQNSTGIPISRTHRWFFRFAALTAPLLLLGVVELGLRLTDFGFPTAFFLDSRQGDRAMLIDNPKFGWRFFPPEVARTPRPLFFPARKPPGTVRVFVFGSSAAMGDPEPAYGFPRQLERILQARHPNQQVEVINTAMTAINSHVIREIAGDCRQREGDFWLLMEGNNEVIGPYGAGTVFGSQAASLPSVRLNLALKTTRLGQLLAGLTRSSREPSSWEGMELFLGYRVAQNDPRLANVYANFAANLTAIVEMGKQSGAKVLVATVGQSQGFTAIRLTPSAGLAAGMNSQDGKNVTYPRDGG
ncbi:MAG: hypothetical protein U1F83_15775 [Verrucomicrobiota bacterium]